MADAVENLIKHLELAIRQFKQLVNVSYKGHADVDKIEGLVIDICDQLEKVVVINDWTLYSQSPTHKVQSWAS